MTERNADHSCERAVGEFLDKYFYGELSSTTRWTFERVRNAEEQLAGIDVKVMGRADDILIDEKAKVHNLNDPVEQFCFEVESLQRGNARCGWFLDSNLRTTHYFLLDVFATHSNWRSLKTEDITCLVGMLVPKSDIWNYLKLWGIEPLKIIQDIKEMREELQRHEWNHHKWYDKASGISLVCSPKLEEKPINIVIPRQVIACLPHTKRYVITKTGKGQFGLPKSLEIIDSILRDTMSRVSALEKELQKLKGGTK